MSYDLILLSKKHEEGERVYQNQPIILGVTLDSPCPTKFNRNIQNIQIQVSRYWILKKKKKKEKCKQTYQCVWPGSSWTGALAFRRSQTCMPDSSSAVIYITECLFHHTEPKERVLFSSVRRQYFRGQERTSYKYMFSLGIVINTSYMSTFNWINLPVLCK